jgi:hypothetical protein
MDAGGFVQVGDGEDLITRRRNPFGEIDLPVQCHVFEQS